MSRSDYETLWLVVGFAGQALFTSRFLVQWAVSEKRKDSVVPVAFWWFSLFGGITLLSYAVHKRDPVIIFGQGMGLLVYVRNLMLVGKAKRRAAKARARAEAVTAALQGEREAAPAPRPHRVDTPRLGVGG